MADGGCTCVGHLSGFIKNVYGYPYDAQDGREDLDMGTAHVVRGGSFGNDGLRARCAYRSFDDDLNFDVGFRVVMSPLSSAR